MRARGRGPHLDDVLEHGIAGVHAPQRTACVAGRVERLEGDVRCGWRGAVVGAVVGDVDVGLIHVHMEALRGGELTRRCWEPPKGGRWRIRRGARAHQEERCTSRSEAGRDTHLLHQLQAVSAQVDARDGDAAVDKLRVGTAAVLEPVLDDGGQVALVAQRLPVAWHAAHAPARVHEVGDLAVVQDVGVDAAELLDGPHENLRAREPGWHTRRPVSRQRAEREQTQAGVTGSCAHRA